MEKIKSSIKSWIESQKGKDVLTILIVILVGLSSFGLGRLSMNTNNPKIDIEYQNQLANTISSNSNNQNMSRTVLDTKIPVIPNSIGKSFFASSRGQKYYSIGCSGGKTIKQENRIYFSTKEEAERAGYELSKSCNFE